MKNDILVELRNISSELEDKFGIKKIALFGSYARGEANDDSDIDILILEMVRKNGFIIAGAKSRSVLLKPYSFNWSNPGDYK